METNRSLEAARFDRILDEKEEKNKAWVTGNPQVRQARGANNILSDLG